MQPTVHSYSSLGMIVKCSVWPKVMIFCNKVNVMLCNKTPPHGIGKQTLGTPSGDRWLMDQW